MHSDAAFTAAMPAGRLDLLDGIGADTVGCLTKLEHEYGPLVSYAKGSERTVFAFGPEVNHAIFTEVETYHVFGPPGPRNSSQRTFQHGLFGLNGAKHLEHRRMLMPPMSKGVVTALAAPIGRLVDEQLNKLEPGQTIDLFATMKELSLALAGRLLFGLDDIPRSTELAETFQTWLDGYIGSLFDMVLPVFCPKDSYAKMLATATKLVEHFRELIQYWKPKPEEPQGNMLGRLILACRAGQIGETEIIGEMQTLLNASYQTTGSALTWTLLLLAQHPEAAKRLYTDLHPESEWLDCVIKESLRILPPVVFALRRMAKSATLAGNHLKEGTVVFPSIYVTHHMPRLFPEPEAFRPERWIGKTVSPYAYLPFGAGPRMCMGTAFALQFFKIAVPAFVKRFRMAIAPGQCVNRHSNLTLGVDGALPVTLLAQDGRFSAVPLTGNIHESVDLPFAQPQRKVA